MATTTLRRIRNCEEKSIRQTFKDCLDYIKNPVKTRNGELVTCAGCAVQNTDLDFEMTRSLYENLTGREPKKDEILAYHMRQSFQPGEVSAEQAHEIGIKLAEAFLKGNHEYVVCTHIDKKHIHNHIIFNAVQSDSLRKYNNEKDSSFKIQKISDKICEEYKLSVIKTPTTLRKSYKEWDAEQQGESWKAKVKKDIDIAIANSNSFNEFLKFMREQGYEIKQGAHIAFRPEDKERFVRAYKLGENYQDEIIKKRIEEVKRPALHKLVNGNRKYKGTILNSNYVCKLPYVYQIAARDKIQTHNKQLYRERKEHIAHVQQLAANLRFLSQEKIHNYKELQQRINEILALKNSTVAMMKELDKKIDEANNAAKAAAAVVEYAGVYESYQKALAKDKYRRENEGSLLIYESAANKLSSLGIKMPVDAAKLADVYKRAISTRRDLQKQYESQEAKIEQLRQSKNMIDAILEKSHNQKTLEKEKV